MSFVFILVVNKKDYELYIRFCGDPVFRTCYRELVVLGELHKIELDVYHNL